MITATFAFKLKNQKCQEILNLASNDILKYGRLRIIAFLLFNSNKANPYWNLLESFYLLVSTQAEKKCNIVLAWAWLRQCSIFADKKGEKWKERYTKRMWNDNFIHLQHVGIRGKSKKIQYETKVITFNLKLLFSFREHLSNVSALQGELSNSQNSQNSGQLFLSLQLPLFTTTRNLRSFLYHGNIF